MKNPGRMLKQLGWALAATAMFAGSALAQQASINLTSSQVHYCNTVNNDWTIEKTVSPTSSSGSPLVSPADVVWTVTATKNAATEGAAPPAQFCVEGSMTIANGGSAPATVGNIVVNVQRMKIPAGDTKKRWVSIGAAVSDAFSRNGATGANVVAAATAENATWNGGFNYTLVGGGAGHFTKMDGTTITLSNGDADVFAVDYTVPGNGSVTFDFVATFDASALGVLASGDHLRSEILVTFGNAGARGGSGASITNVDIDGDGKTDCNDASVTFNKDNDECNVRTVPMRFSLDVPPLELCNDNITIADVLNGGLLSHDVMVQMGTPTGDVEGDCQSASACNLSMAASGTTTWTIPANLSLANGALSGSVSNVATFTGHHVIAGTTTEPTTDCCTTDTGTASTVTYLVAPEDDCTVTGTCGQCPCGPPGPDGVCCGGGEGTYCTFTKGKFQSSAKNPTVLTLAQQWGHTVFTSGLTLGQGSATDNSADPGTWAAFWEGDPSVLVADPNPKKEGSYHSDGLDALRDYITGANKGGSSFGSDQGTNPTTTPATNLGQQTAALVLSTTMGDAGLLGTGNLGVGGLNICLVGTFTGTCSTSVTVNQLIGISNMILSGDATTGYSAGFIQDLLNSLNNAFDDCKVLDQAFVDQYIRGSN